LLAAIAPNSANQSVFEVAVTPPNGTPPLLERGINARGEIEASIRDAKRVLAQELPDRIITLGGNCLVSLVPFDYLSGKYENLGVLWIDTHPDVSTPDDGYPNAHAMVLGTLLGGGDAGLRDLMDNPSIKPQNVLYIGLQPLHDYQSAYLQKAGVSYRVQEKEFLSDDEIRAFLARFDHVAVHLDIDVLDEHYFGATYFANPELKGDGSGGGKMRLDKLAQILNLINANADVVGFTFAEYLPFEAEKLNKMLSNLKIFND